MPDIPNRIVNHVIVQMRMDGALLKEIADRVGMTKAEVWRRLQKIIEERSAL